MGRHLTTIERTIARYLCPSDLVTTRHAGHAVTLARQAVADGVELLVSVGGDGTHSEIANGVLMAGGSPGETSLGIVHAGTGGDFRRMIPNADSLKSCCEIVRDGSPRLVDVIRATFVSREGRSATRYALNMISLGLGADVVRRRHDAPMQTASSVAYLTGALAAFRRRQTRSVDLGIDGQEPVTVKATMLCVCNGRYAGGGMRFAPNGCVTDGLLDVVALDMTSLTAAVAIAVSLYAGDVGARSQVQRFVGREISVEGEPLALEVDGEWAGCSPARFEVLPRALAVMFPRVGDR